MRWNGRIFWLLAFSPTVFRTHLFPAFTAVGTQTRGLCSSTIGSWEIVSSYSSATPPVSHRISRADPLDANSQRTDARSSKLCFRVQDLFRPFSDETAAERTNRSIRDQLRLLRGKVAENLIAVCGRNDRPGQVTKIIRNIVALDRPKCPPDLGEYIRRCMKVGFVIFSPRLQRFGPVADCVQKIIIFHQKIGGVEPTDCVAKPTQRFFISHFVGKIFHDQSPAHQQAVSSPLHSFVQRMDVMKRTSKKDSIELASVKIGPGGMSGVDAELPRGSDTVAVTVDRNYRKSVLEQARRQLP